MNPCDALPGDFNLYFDRTWMFHLTLQRVVQVSAEDGDLSYKVPGGRWQAVETLDDLVCWWPRAGAYNVGARAIFVGRRARRNMKKSAYDHYFVQWGVADGDVNYIMASGDTYLSYDAAREVLNNRVAFSCAISPDLILERRADQKDHFNVVYRGTPCGELKNNRFIPVFDGTPAAKRAELKLVQEGVECI